MIVKLKSVCKHCSRKSKKLWQLKFLQTAIGNLEENGFWIFPLTLSICLKIWDWKTEKRKEKCSHSGAITIIKRLIFRTLQIILEIVWVWLQGWKKIQMPTWLFLPVLFCISWPKQPRYWINQKVLIPDLKAGCSLSDSCPPELFKNLRWASHHVVITYINCSAGMKALSDDLHQQ